MNQAKNIRGAIILADESAEWRIAGLRQVERLSLGLNEYFNRAPGGDVIPVCICWTGPPSSTCPRFLHDRRLTSVHLTDDFERFLSELERGAGDIVVMNTRLLIDRGAFKQIFREDNEGVEVPILFVSAAAAHLPSDLNSSLLARISAAILKASSPPAEGGDHKWWYLNGREQVKGTEKFLLAGTAKPQDGVISRFINRPISRSVSRLLVHFPLSPNHWTLIMSAIPLAGSILLLQGNYRGFALGAILFQIHSALDGCDGEIARVKYLESDFGAKLDGLCDRFATLLYAVSLGFGLSRQTPLAFVWRWIFPLEGIVAALLIGVTETWLSRNSLDEVAAVNAGEHRLSPEYLKAHRSSFNPGDQLKLWIIKNSGLLFLGDGLTSLFGQLTKRDVFNFGFMLLALCGRPSWILHILAICACAIMAVAVKDLIRPAFDPGRLRSG